MSGKEKDHKTEDEDQSDSVLSSQKKDAEKAKKYWTKEEMEKAKPIPFPNKKKKANNDSPEPCDDE